MNKLTAFELSLELYLEIQSKPEQFSFHIYTNSIKNIFKSSKKQQQIFIHKNVISIVKIFLFIYNSPATPQNPAIFKIPLLLLMLIAVRI